MVKTDVQYRSWKGSINLAFCEKKKKRFPFLSITDCESFASHLRGLRVSRDCLALHSRVLRKILQVTLRKFTRDIDNIVSISPELRVQTRLALLDSTVVENLQSRIY